MWSSCLRASFGWACAPKPVNTNMATKIKRPTKRRLAGEKKSLGIITIIVIWLSELVVTQPPASIHSGDRAPARRRTRQSGIPSLALLEAFAIFQIWHAWGRACRRSF